MAPPKIYLFWDNSNIYHSAQRFAEQNEGIGARNSVRVSFENLFKLALAARPMEKGIAVGSVPPEHEELWNRFKENTNLELELYERGELSGKEQGVDQCLQTHMLRAIADESDPQIAVLLTGDGKGYDDGVGFHADLERMYKAGWGIEVISWDLACKSALKRWATSVGSYIKLESFYNSVTFIQSGRYASQLSLIHRQKSTIGGSPEYKKQQKKIQDGADSEKNRNDLEQKLEEIQEQLEKERKKREKAEGKAKYQKRIANISKKKSHR